MSTTTCIQIKVWTDIHGPQQLNPTDFGEPKIFPVAQPHSKNIHSGKRNMS